LNPGGVAYYNTTWSDDVLATGASVFPYAVRISSFLAVSDSPLALDKDRWRSALGRYSMDGRPVFDLANPAEKQRLDEVLHLADELDIPAGGIESRQSLLRRLTHARAVTDDNMGTEWN